jgi:hypothetical protein
MFSVEFVKHAKPDEKLEVHEKKKKNLKRQNLLNMKKKKTVSVYV